MKILIVVILSLLTTDPLKISKINAIKKEAEKAFLEKKFEIAIEKYSLLDSMNVEDSAIDLNLANAYFELKDTTNANILLSCGSKFF